MSAALLAPSSSPTSLAALHPAPREVASDSPPPWAPPALRVRSEPPPFPNGALTAFLLAGVLGSMALMTEGATMIRPLVAGSVGLLLVAIGALVMAVRERPATLSRHAEHLQRARMTWARIVEAAIVGQRRRKNGVLEAYEVAVQLAVWPASGSSPVTLSHRLFVPATAGASVVPGAYLGVLHDPVDDRIVPQSLVTCDGAQLPL